MTLGNFIKKRSHLFWHIKDFDNLSQKALVETILNYGDFDDVKKMIKIIGLKKTASIFWKESKQKRCNYRPEIKNYFQFYFNKYA